MARKSVCDTIVETIMDKIRSGELKPGQQLPNEKDFAEQFDVSVISLREALRVLSAKGLVITLHGKGTYINTYNTDLIAETFSTFALLDNSPLIEMIQLRKIMETQAARLCAANATEEELEEIKIHKQLREQYCAAKPTPEHIAQKYEHDRMFHFLIARASHNEIFSRFIESIQKSIDKHQVFASRTEEDIEKTTYYHNEIMKGLESRNSDYAGHMMWKHMEQIETSIVPMK